MYRTEQHAARSSDPLHRAARRAPLLDAATERRLLLEARAGSSAATEKLVVAHLRVVLSLAPSYRRAGISLDDLVSEGVLGLLEAIERFDCERENRFATYARWWVRSRLRRFVGATRHIVLPPSTRIARRLLQSYGRVHASETQRLGRTPTREELAVALDARVEDVAAIEPVLGRAETSLSERSDGTVLELTGSEPSPEESLDDAERDAHRRRCVQTGLSALTERERFVLLSRLANDEPESLSELGKTLSVSRERVRQVQQRASEKFRNRLRYEGAVR